MATAYSSPIILITIVVAQFCCTSLWFAGNGVMGELIDTFSLPEQSLGHLTAAVQLGFILGTLTFAVFTIADRLSPSKVFLICAILGSFCNLGAIWQGHTLMSLLSIRAMTGFFLAGIYPVGMKIAADHYSTGLGKSLGLLVGALVLGTAFPHLAKGLSAALPWRSVLMITSSLAALGGILMWLLVPDGPYRVRAKSFDPSAFVQVFKRPGLRSAALGYFGHMWELYAFWAFVPVLLKTYLEHKSALTDSIPVASFSVIGIGSIGCIVGGFLSDIWGEKRTAFVALCCSCVCCLVTPWMYALPSYPLFICFLLIWGFVVIPDSPLFSSLVAQQVEASIKGTALTIINCIGFAITIISIQLLNTLSTVIDPRYVYPVLAVGPVMGLWALHRHQSDG